MKAFTITDTIQGATWHRVVDPAVALIDRTLAISPAGLDRTPAQIAMSKARMAWNTARAAVDQVPAVLEALPGEIVAARVNGDLTDDAKRRLVNAAIDAAQTQLSSLGDTARTKLTRVDDLLRAASLPAKPGDSVADEAKYAAAKTDLRMVLDAEPADLMPLCQRAGELLQRALGDGDAHTAWVLAGSRWPADYIRTRDRTLSEAQVASVITSEVGGVLDAMTGTDARSVRRAYRVVVSVDGTWAIEAAMGMFPGLLDDVRTWTLREMPGNTSGF